MMCAKGKQNTSGNILSLSWLTLDSSVCSTDAQQVFGSTDEKVDDRVTDGDEETWRHKGRANEQATDFKYSFCCPILQSHSKLQKAVFHIYSTLNWIGSRKQTFWLSSRIFNNGFVFILFLFLLLRFRFAFFLTLFFRVLSVPRKGLSWHFGKTLDDAVSPVADRLGNLNPREHTFTFNRLASSQWIDQRNEGAVYVVVGLLVL